jgi:hypothetical protein
VAKSAASLGLTHPRDRNGAIVSDRYSTNALEAALEAYRGACARAAEEVRRQLRALSTRLLVRQPTAFSLSLVDLPSFCNREKRDLLRFD